MAPCRVTRTRACRHRPRTTMAERRTGIGPAFSAWENPAGTGAVGRGRTTCAGQLRRVNVGERGRTVTTAGARGMGLARVAVGDPRGRRRPPRRPCAPPARWGSRPRCELDAPNAHDHRLVAVAFAFPVSMTVFLEECCFPTALTGVRFAAVVCLVPIPASCATLWNETSRTAAASRTRAWPSRLATVRISMPAVRSSVATKWGKVVHAYFVEVEAFSVSGPSCGHEVRVPGPGAGRVVGEDLLVGSDRSVSIRLGTCEVFAQRHDGLCGEGDEPDVAGLGGLGQPNGHQCAPDRRG